MRTKQRKPVRLSNQIKKAFKWFKITAKYDDGVAMSYTLQDGMGHTITLDLYKPKGDDIEEINWFMERVNFIDSLGWWAI